MNFDEAAARFVDYLDKRLLVAGRGDAIQELDVEPTGRLWLGRLAPEEAIMARLDDGRGDRMEPCAIGMRVKLATVSAFSFCATISAVAWKKDGKKWIKTETAVVTVPVENSGAETEHMDKRFGEEEIRQAFSKTFGFDGLRGAVQVEIEAHEPDKIEAVVSFVNTSPEVLDNEAETTLFECNLRIDGLDHEPFELDALPDAFRYDRKVAAYGVNCGVEVLPDGAIQSTDTTLVDRRRPRYWCVEDREPDFRFATLATDPIKPATDLLGCYERWANREWSVENLDSRSTREQWSPEMRTEADRAAGACREEIQRIENGISLLRSNEDVAKAFRLMNSAMAISSRGRYDSWRPFQIGFLLANLVSILGEEDESSVADIVWFATGGGKTETYLGLLVTAAFHDRITGKISGITAWSRFPLRMLSLQQTQRFADAMAGAELTRQREGLDGDPFSVGFLVGRGATPNSIDPDSESSDPWNPDDPTMPERARVLISCPFCHQESIEMAFDRLNWKLEHRCGNSECPWEGKGLPFYVVDDEIYRFLPTVVVGTLDKAATISFQTAMRGLVASPWAKCDKEGHGYSYAPRGKKPNGCLVPGCPGSPTDLGMPPERFAPSFRLQDELHLLRDSLGAVDAHYESLLDGLEHELSGRRPKILASSATLTGYERQVETLYRRQARVFPEQGPTANRSFWTEQSDALLRRFVAVSPRGVTLEYALDRMITELQRITRELVSDPTKICGEAAIPVEHADNLASFYGVNVVYGNTIRDLDAVVRSMDTQIPVEPPVQYAVLTGRSEFDEVRRTLDRLKGPEIELADRIHVVAASSMMSHGVDLDRLNVMLMMGLPLSASEFIQATARVGRARPGLVFVLGKIARERDAAVFRNFEKFVTHGDRFIEPIPITRRSRRILEKTAAGLFMARVWMKYEPESGKALTRIPDFRAYLASMSINPESELKAVCEYLGLDDPMYDLLRDDLEQWVELFFDRIETPPNDANWTGKLPPGGAPMMSLRDVEEQAPVVGTTGS